MGKSLPSAAHARLLCNSRVRTAGLACRTTGLVFRYGLRKPRMSDSGMPHSCTEQYWRLYRSSGSSGHRANPEPCMASQTAACQVGPIPASTSRLLAEVGARSTSRCRHISSAAQRLIAPCIVPRRCCIAPQGSHGAHLRKEVARAQDLCHSVVLRKPGRHAHVVGRVCGQGKGRKGHGSTRSGRRGEQARSACRQRSAPVHRHIPFGSCSGVCVK